MNDWLGIAFCIGGGVFTLCAVHFKWGFFWSDYRARFLVKIAGETGARVFYGLLGVLVLSVGITMLLAKFK